MAVIGRRDVFCGLYGYGVFTDVYEDTMDTLTEFTAVQLRSVRVVATSPPALKTNPLVDIYCFHRSRARSVFVSCQRLVRLNHKEYQDVCRRR